MEEYLVAGSWSGSLDHQHHVCLTEDDKEMLSINLVYDLPKTGGGVGPEMLARSL